MEFGYVVLLPREVNRREEDGELKPILRRATDKDRVQLERNRKREEYAFDVCLKKIEKFKCPMKLLRVEYTFDRSKIVFFFTAEGAWISGSWSRTWLRSSIRGSSCVRWA